MSARVRHEPTRGWLVLLFALATLATLASSCAYYNTFYLARKYYNKATEGRPYVVQKGLPTAQSDFKNSIDYSKKVISNYPTSKWVDDAYLLWARSLLGTDDPGQTVNMLQEFENNFPNSPLKAEAKFYLGVGYLQSRRYREAITAFDAFLALSPRHDLAPFAYLEKSRALMSLDRPAEAAASADVILSKFAKKAREQGLDVESRAARAEARLAEGEFELALRDYRDLGLRSRTDAERFEYLLREADCLEAARRFDDELDLLREALSHEREPSMMDTTRGRPAQVRQVTGYDRYGRLLIRMGTAHLLAGRHEQALESYQRVVEDYPLAPLAGEAQYRIGYVYETIIDDFDQARAAYGEVQKHAGGSSFGQQAQSRLNSLERLAQFRTSEGDTVQKKAEQGFMLAEIYLFQQDKPERALEQYQAIEREFDGTPSAGKALNAQAWVLRRLDRNAEADSLLWRVIHQYPATEAQIAARDYLEQAGYEVPTNLIKFPEVKRVAADTVAAAPRPAPSPSTMATGDTTRGGLQSAIQSGLFRTRAGPSGAPGDSARAAARDTAGTPRLPDTVRDTSRTMPVAAPADSAVRAGAARDTARTPAAAPAPADSARAGAARDTARTPAAASPPADSSRAPVAVPRDTTAVPSSPPAAADTSGARP